MGHAKGGRNNGGKVTVRHHGGGARRRIRMVDFTRMEAGEQVVDRIEYDPNRSAHLALITHKKTGEKNYIIAPEGLRAGDVVTSYRAGIPEELIKSMGGHIDPGVLAAKTAFRGNCLPLHLIPPGTQVHCVGFLPERRAIFCRSAGTFATVIGKDEAETVFRHMIVRLQSGEIRKVHKDACATIGTVSNPMYQFRQLGKAGRSRWLNIRPTVRGLAMNAGRFFYLDVDH
jgi:ribosomal protein L2